MKENKDKIKSFLIEYNELCKKHGLSISGCGCCGSPYIIGGLPDLFHHLEEESIISIVAVIKVLNDPQKVDEHDLTEEDKKTIVDSVLYGIKSKYEVQ